MKPHRPPPPRAPTGDIPQRTPHDDLLQVVAELDRTDPGWRLDEIEAQRKVIPDERNGMQKIRAILKVLRPLHWPSQEAHDRFIAATAAAHLRLPPQDAGYLRAELQQVAPALAEARMMDQYPEGRIPIAWSRRGSPGTMMPEHQDLRAVVTVLYWDAVLEADLGNMNQAIRSCHGIFNCCRTIGDDPTIIPHLVRMAMARTGVSALERVLAQGNVDGSALDKLQTVISEEAAQRATDHRRGGSEAAYIGS